MLSCGWAVVSEPDPAVWTISQPGDIIVHGVFPLRRRFANTAAMAVHSAPLHTSGLNYEGLIWLGAMIERISEMNEAGFVPGNLTIGYDIRDSCCHPDIGLKQTLSATNQIINNEHKMIVKKDFHIPVLIGPACDKVEENSYKLLEILNLPRISYTTTSFRFNQSEAGELVRSVPSDLLHIDALLRVLTNMGKPRVSVVSSREKLWRERAKVFQLNMKKRQYPVRTAIYTDTIYNTSSIGRLLHGSKVVVVFGGAKPTRMLIKREKLHGLTWISVGKFDSPLLRIFDKNGKLLNKTIVRNIVRSNFKQYQNNIMKKLTQTKDNYSGKMKWLDIVWDKYSKECQQNGTVRRKECIQEVFYRKIKTLLKENDRKSRSTLTIQGIFDAVDLIVNSLVNILQKNCAGRESVMCLSSASSHHKWLEILRSTKLTRQDGGAAWFNKHSTLTGHFSVEVLRRVRDMFGRRVMVPKGWLFKKVQEWNITEDLSYLVNNTTVFGDDKPGIIDNTSHIIKTHLNDTSLVDVPLGGHGNKSCSDCRDNGENLCQFKTAIIHWTNSWAIALYILQFLILCAVLATLVFFIKNKDSPIMILCCSWPDNVVLVVLCLFTCLPIMHIGELSFGRCLFLWPAVNVIFGLYLALLLSKTLFVQNLLNCEVATDRPARRILFSFAFTILHLGIVIAFSALGFVTATKSACSTLGVVVVCDIQNSTGIFFSMALNCILVLVLVALSIRETRQQRQNFCRTENLIGVAIVAMVTYFCSIIIAYFNLVLKHHLIVTLFNCLLLLANPIVCLILVYLPTIRLVSTWLRQHTRQQKNLTSIKRAQVISAAKRHSATGPSHADSLFNMNFNPAVSLLQSPRSTGYYFDMRCPSPNHTDMSFPNSLVRSIHEPTHVVFGYGRPGMFGGQGTVSEDESAGIQTSMEELETMSRDSYYDNVPAKPSHHPNIHDVFREIASYCKPENDDGFINKQCEEDTYLKVEGTKKGPYLQKTKT